MSAPIRAALASKTSVAPDVVDLRFRVETPSDFAFAPGQFLTLSVGKNESGRAMRRSYSIASPADDPRNLRFLLKLIPGGPGSDFFASLPIGAPVEMTGPHGFFTLSDAHPGDVIFAATGTGIAPVMPMLAALAATSGSGRRIVYWGLRHEFDLFVREEIEALCRDAKAELRIFLSRPSPGWEEGRGHITPVLLAAAPQLSQPIFYLVGNGAMIREAKKGLMAAGIDRKKQIRTEAFFD